MNTENDPGSSSSGQPLVTLQRSAVVPSPSASDCLCATNVFPEVIPQTRNAQGWLTAVLVLLMLVQPLLEQSRSGVLIMAFLGTSTVLAALYAVSWNNRRLAAGLLLALPSILTTWSFVFQQSASIGVAQVIAMIPFHFYTLITILQKIFRSRHVRLNELFGALNVYILFGISWGLIYFLLEIFFPHSFELSGSATTPSSFIYYSFSILGTLGIGDIRPVWPFARMLSVIQMLFGLFFVTVSFGKLVAVFHYESASEDPALTEQQPFERTLRLASQIPRWSLIPIIAGANLLTSLLSETFHMPLFLDTWATSVGAILGGLWCGLFGGMLYNLLMAAGWWGQSSWVWCTNSAVVALLSYSFFKRRWLDLNRPLLLLGCGIATGIVSAISGSIVLRLSGLPRSASTVDLYHAVLQRTGSNVVADLIQQCVTEGMDKTVSLVVAVIVVFAIGELKKDRGYDIPGTIQIPGNIKGQQ